MWGLYDTIVEFAVFMAVLYLVASTGRAVVRDSHSRRGYVPTRPGQQSHVRVIPPKEK